MSRGSWQCSYSYTIQFKYLTYYSWLDILTSKNFFSIWRVCVRHMLVAESEHHHPYIEHFCKHRLYSCASFIWG